VSYSSTPSYEPPGDRAAPRFFASATTGTKRPTSVRSVVGVCLGVLLLPCVAVGAYWAVITFVNGSPF
jgi:hypothetical protein